SSRYSIGDNNSFNRLNGWSTQDVFISHRISCKHFRADLKAELSNLGDVKYDVVRSYPMPGRSYRISITFLNQ
ncbi:MAG: TonB-dependent receptor, partial [Chitinophagaceae bacterium]